MENLVRCRSIKTGEYVDVHRDKIIERNCVYAFALYGGSVLFLNTKSSGKDWLPGGGIEGDETLREALHREMREETGIKIRIHHMEECLWHEGRQEAYRQTSHFFACIALTHELVDHGATSEREETNMPHWVPIEEVGLDQLQPTLSEFFPSVRDELLQLIEEGA